MPKRLQKSALSVLLSTLFLLGTGVVIWLFIQNSGSTLQDILFYVGAAPIALFSVGMFGDFFGRGTQSYQLSRSVSRHSPNQRAQKDVEDNENKVASGIIWIIAGLLVWIISYLSEF